MDPSDENLRSLLDFAILAPSAKNSQPWHFAVRGNKVFIIADLVRTQPVSDPDRRELYISLGCALENLLVAAEHFGLGHSVSYFPQRWHQNLAATVLFHAGGSLSPARSGTTVDAIRRRHDDTGMFLWTCPSVELQHRLTACRVEPDLDITLTDDDRFHQRIGALTVQSDEADLANPAFEMELARSDCGPLEPEMVILQNHIKVRSAPLLGLIRGAADDHLIHVRAGQLLERVWLTGTALGLSINPMSQTLRRPDLRSAVAALLPGDGWIPQHLFRVGYSAAPSVVPSPRRPVEDVLL